MKDLNFDLYCSFQYKINEALGEKIPHIRKYNVRGELGSDSWVDLYDVGDGKVYNLKISEIKKVPALKGKSIDNSKSFIQNHLIDLLDKYNYKPIFKDGPIVIYELPCGLVKFEIIKKLGLKF